MVEFFLISLYLDMNNTVQFSCISKNKIFSKYTEYFTSNNGFKQ